MATYPVLIAQYSRDSSCKLPFHWEIVIKTGIDTSGRKPRPIGMAFQLFGSSQAGFSPLNWVGCLPVGSIPADRMEHVTSLLSQVEIRQGSEWNCQNWVQLGLRKMSGHGYAVDQQLAQSFDILQHKMSELYVLWNAGDA
ncbi:hypothetical protein B0H21DRAFT_740683 [Amylocystis lapponica]|nr:hypothetical protein B0H21DRAFT_740683 [Amylocystis lapponica]